MIAVQRFNQQVRTSQNKPKVPQTGRNHETIQDPIRFVGPSVTLTKRFQAFYTEMIAIDVQKEQIDTEGAAEHVGF